MTVPYTLPDPVNLGTVYRGDTVELPVWVATVRGVPVEEGGEVIDLTGATGWFTAKQSLKDDDAEAPGFQLSTATEGVTIIDGPAGEYQVVIPPTATVTLEKSTSFSWDVQWRTAGDPQTLTVARGTLVVAEDVTRSVA